MEYDIGHCRPDELFDLVDLANRVFRAGRPGDMGSEYPLVFEAPNAEIAGLAGLVDDAMTHALDLTVPLKVDLASGPNWLDVRPVA